MVDRRIVISDTSGRPRRMWLEDISTAGKWKRERLTRSLKIENME